MNYFKGAMVSLAILGFAGTAQAQDNDFYINLGVDSYDFDAYGIGAKLGQNFHENFGLEVQGSTGIIDDEFEIAGFEVDSNIDFSIAAFLTARVETQGGASFFVRGGYHYTEGSLNVENVGGGSFKESADGFAIGGGVQFMVDDVNGIRAEVTHLDADDNASGEIYSLSYVRKF